MVDLEARGDGVELAKVLEQECGAEEEDHGGGEFQDDERSAERQARERQDGREAETERTTEASGGGSGEDFGIQLWQQSDNVPFEQSRNVPLTVPGWWDGTRTTTDDAG